MSPSRMLQLPRPSSESDPQPAASTVSAPPATGEPSARRVRVLTVDDSPLVRLALERYLQAYPDLQLVGHARHGREMLDLVEKLKPDMVILDVEMPEMDGLTALERLMATHPRPVIMLSYLTTEGADATLEALELGALDFVTKPGPGVTLASTVRTLAEKIRRYAHMPLRLGHQRAAPPPAVTPQVEKGPPEQERPRLPMTAADRLVIVASSTGGPAALAAFLRALPADLPLGGVIVQHIPQGFERFLAMRLNQAGPYRVLPAEDGYQLHRGEFLVAPGGVHLVLAEGYRVQLVHAPPVHSVRPAADVTLEHAACQFGRQVVAVVLTGMGQDGYRGAQQVRAHGGMVLTQDQVTSVVYSMPRYVAEAGLSHYSGSPQALAAYLAAQVEQT